MYIFSTQKTGTEYYPSSRVSHAVSALLLLLLSSQIVGIPNNIVLKRPIETVTIILRKRNALLHPIDKVRVADEVPAINQRVVFPGLDLTP